MSAVPMRKAASEPTDNAGEALSAFMDGEADMLSFRVESARQRQDWDTYHLIGDILRSEALACRVSSRFSRNLSAALQAEPPIVAPRPRQFQRFISRYAIPGAALTIVVIAVTWIAQPYIAPVTSLQAGVAPSSSALISAASPNPVLVDYVEAHRHMTDLGESAQANPEAMQQ